MPTPGPPRRMPFGRYKGKLLEDIPTDYLRWVAENVDGRGGLVAEVEEQLKLREGLGRVVEADRDPDQG